MPDEVNPSAISHPWCLSDRRKDSKPSTYVPVQSGHDLSEISPEPCVSQVAAPVSTGSHGETSENWVELIN